MIIEKFATLFSSIFFKLFSGLNIPVIDALDSINDTVSMILKNGAMFVMWLVPSAVLKAALVITLAMIGIKYTYYLVMWLLKKIPVAGIN